MMTYTHIKIWAVPLSAAAFRDPGTLWYRPVMFSKHFQT
jgi:hypothetical protein